jgi:hypothetical protein
MASFALMVKASSLLWVSSRPHLRDDTIEPILAKIPGQSKSMDLYAVCATVWGPEGAVKEENKRCAQ